MPRKSDTVKDKLQRGITEDRFSVIMDVKLVQKMKIIAAYMDTTEKDLYKVMMTEFVAQHSDIPFPAHLNNNNLTVKKGK